MFLLKSICYAHKSVIVLIESMVSKSHTYNVQQQPPHPYSFYMIWALSKQRITFCIGFCLDRDIDHIWQDTCSEMTEYNEDIA